ncbi:MAG: hypothetical protein J6C93_00630 [Clostridia bacterium]|nr:hypothetical protein [Clostridia bacterium]
MRRPRLPIKRQESPTDFDEKERLKRRMGDKATCADRVCRSNGKSRRPTSTKKNGLNGAWTIRRRAPTDFA